MNEALREAVDDKIDLFHQDGETLSELSALREIYEAIDEGHDLSARSLYPAVKDELIARGCFVAKTLEQLGRMTSTGAGRKYDFQRKGLLYVFETWSI